MPITISLPPTITLDAAARVEALAFMLCENDTNFKGVQIETVRSDDAMAVSVLDAEDDLRGRLLRHLVDEALKDGPESIMGDLY